MHKLDYFRHDIPKKMLAESQIVCTNLDNCNIVKTSLIKKILVPYDNSQYSQRAFAHALDVARKYGASIIVVTVTNENQEAEWVHDTPTRQKGINKSRNAEFKQIFKSLESIATKFQIHFDSTILQSNNAAESIISFASYKRVDYIIMGTHGEGKSKEMMLGRVSTNIALNAHCPVVLVK